METNHDHPLTPDESNLLSAFLLGQLSLVHLAQEAGLSLSELMDWLQSPRIQAAIATYTRLTETALALASLRARAEAVEALRIVAADSADPIERRRAATALIRATATAAARPTPQPRAATPATAADTPATDIPAADTSALPVLPEPAEPAPTPSATLPTPAPTPTPPPAPTPTHHPRRGSAPKDPHPALPTPTPELTAAAAA